MPSRDLPACRRLIVGCDFSAGAAAAARLAVAFAAGRALEVELVHALEREPPGAEALALLSLELRRVGEEAGVGRAGLRAGATVVRRPAGDVLRQLAALDDSTWIVVGAEGASASSLPAGGRLAMALATAAAAPLLVAPLAWAPRRAGGSLPEVARILVGLGDALDGERLVARACALAGRLGARLAVAHVVETTDVAAWPEPLRAAGLERSRADAEERLAAMQVAFEETVPVELGDEVHLAFGGPVARDLAGLADSQHADLLVVGSGVSAARLVPLARCPLLVLPTKKGDGPLIQKNPRAPARPAGFSE